MTAKHPTFFKECPICFETIRETKLTICGHEFCLKCLEKLSVQSKEKTPATCPSCRGDPLGGAAPKDLESRFYGHLVCDFCLEDKSVDDIWFCQTCVKILCSRCEITDHKARNHSDIESWLSGLPHRKCSGVLRLLAKEKEQLLTAEREEFEQSLPSYFQEVMEALLRKKNNLSERGEFKEAKIAKQLEASHHFSEPVEEGADVTLADAAPWIKIAGMAAKLSGTKEDFESESVLGRFSDTELRSRLPPETLADIILSKLRPGIPKPPTYQIQRPIFQLPFHENFRDSRLRMCWGRCDLMIAFDTGKFETWELPVSTKSVGKPTFSAAVTVAEGCHVLLVSICAEADIVFVLIDRSRSEHLILVYANSCGRLLTQFMAPKTEQIAPIQSGMCLYISEQPANLHKLTLNKRFV